MVEEEEEEGDLFFRFYLIISYILGPPCTVAPFISFIHSLGQTDREISDCTRSRLRSTIALPAYQQMKSNNSSSI